MTSPLILTDAVSALSFTSWRRCPANVAGLLITPCETVRQRPPGSELWAALLAARCRAALAARVAAVRIGSSWTNSVGRSALDNTARR